MTPYRGHVTFEVCVRDELLDAVLPVDLGLVVRAVLRDEEERVLEVLHRGALRVHQVPVQHVELTGKILCTSFCIDLRVVLCL